MSLRIDKEDTVSLDIVNRKLEAFVEIVLKKMVDQQQQIKALKGRIALLEKKP